ncbi:glycoside hydrolase family 18 protein [Periconia macrospinosa]|uniref:Glycoside hydrolase family 18 protein n=1 Tax=Periconia macrospinosa TaxID=97972 RepID=A0A2V1DDP9_9PLEO|nr:glycoside hydrolase family 18 protein [Periconia macrospinosa]
MWHNAIAAGELQWWKQSKSQGVDGTCYSYLVKELDTCWTLVETYHTTVQAIEDSNKKTRGWAGCDGIQWGMNICLGHGNPPFPANSPEAICGPQMNNTEKPTDYTKWPGLNPCPLNACCDVWGQCGTMAQFYPDTRAPTGNDGTEGGPGENGCISNCGTKIVAGSPPAKFERVYISNLEIGEIISSGQHMIQQEHNPIAGDILIYDDTEWVSWSDVAYPVA